MDGVQLLLSTFSPSGHIHSCCGVQQGDPLGPLGFALTLHPIVERIKAEVPDLLLNALYLDDGMLVGFSVDLIEVHASQYSSFLRNLTSLTPHCYQMSLSSTRAPVYWATLSVLPPTVRRCYRRGS